MSIYVIDDYETSRQSMIDLLNTVSLEAIPVMPILKKISEQVALYNAKSDFLISDYRLNAHSYAAYSGDLLIAEAYKHNIPGILCSSYTGAMTSLSRTLRRYIPYIFDSSEFSCKLNSDKIIEDYKDIICKEFDNIFIPQRKPWRALIRTVEFDNETNTVYAEIPSWNVNTKINIPLKDFDKVSELKEKVKKDIVRFHAMVNLACDDIKSLYISDIEEE